MSVRGLLLGLLVCAAGNVFSLHAQSDRLRKIDSLLNPVTDASGVSMQFDSLVVDAGRLREEGKPSTYVFRWRNAGDKALAVTRVSTGCGCAAPAFDMKRVGPGESSEIRVTYYPKGHPGRFSRKIAVFTDISGNRPAKVLELKGYVEPAAMPTWNYPVAMGPLLLKRSEVHIAGDRLQTERILCLNAGDAPLEIVPEKALLPDWLAVWCEPAVIAPGEKADIVVRFFSDKAAERLPSSLPVILNGVRLPPSKRTIKILIDKQ